MLSRVGCSEAQQGHGIWGALFSSGTGVHLAPHTQMPSGKLRIFMWELQMPGDDPHSGAPWSVSLAGWRQLLRPLCTQAVISKHPLPGQWAPTGELKRVGRPQLLQKPQSADPRSFHRFPGGLHSQPAWALYTGQRSRQPGSTQDVYRFRRMALDRQQPEPRDRKLHSSRWALAEVKILKLAAA